MVPMKTSSGKMAYILHTPSWPFFLGLKMPEVWLRVILPAKEMLEFCSLNGRGRCWWNSKAAQNPSNHAVLPAGMSVSLPCVNQQLD